MNVRELVNLSRVGCEELRQNSSEYVRAFGRNLCGTVGGIIVHIFCVRLLTSAVLSK